MNSRNSFSSLTITQLVIHLTGALLELYADDTQEIQVMASGDDHDMKAVSLVQNGDTLTMEQSAAALSPLRPLAASDRPHSAHMEGTGRDSHDVRQRACPRFAGQ